MHRQLNLAMQESPAPTPTFRSSAVAAMARMPVATLRIWEQRHGAVRPAVSPGGHRLYSAADVERVLLLRQLTERGHGIGALAALDTAQLQAAARLGAAVAGGGRAGPLRVVAVGPGLAARLQRPSLRHHLARPLRVLAAHGTLAEAARSAADRPADLLLWLAPALHADVPSELEAARTGARAARLVVMFRHASAAALKTWAALGIGTVREPADDEAFGAWLATQAAGPASPAAAEPGGDTMAPEASAPAVRPRRYDDDTLAAVAALSPALACECPRHVAELLMQLTSFEAYSAGCDRRTPADGELHAYLHQVAGLARALFESALERVARHEGLAL